MTIQSMLRALLILESGIAEPRTCPLDPAKPLSLGRHTTNQLVLQDELASRWHAEVYFSDGNWFIRDTGARNASRVDGRPIHSDTRLEPGSLILVGQTAFRFVLEEPARLVTERSTATPYPGQPGLNHPGSSQDETSLGQDELSVLCWFISWALQATDRRGLIERALEAIHTRIGASVTAYLSLDTEDSVPKLVLPASASIDAQLSRSTASVQKQGQFVWLGSRKEFQADSESLLAYQDALGVPLRTSSGTFGLLHIYKQGRLLNEREVHFCVLLASHLASGLLSLRTQRKLEAEVERLREGTAVADELIGNGPVMERLRQQITRFAPARATVLILGESGVGKELVAQMIHRQGSRADEPLVIVNSAAIPSTLLESQLFGHRRGAFTGALNDQPGFFESADGGTLFFDEIGELSAEAQAKLLRVIETRRFMPVGSHIEVEVDVRIVAATNRDLAREAAEGRFRKDLFFRLQGLEIRVPPLREHPEDIEAIADHLLAQLAPVWGRRCRLHSTALKRLETYAWPGNVRQLRSVLENALANSSESLLRAGDLLLADQTEDSPGPASLKLEELERWAIQRGLKQTKGNLSQTARLLGIARETLHLKMKKYEIEKTGAQQKPPSK